MVIRSTTRMDSADAIAPTARDDVPVLLAAIPPNRAQYRMALAVAAGLAIAFLAVAPFATVSLPRLDAFIPAVQTAIACTNLVTAALLFAQFQIVRWPALLVLANAYLFTGDTRAALEDIIADGRRADDVISGIRAMIRRDTRRKTWFDVNHVVDEVLRSLDVDLRAHQVSVSTELGEGLPSVHGNQALVGHVILNLITNALEAMDPISARPRLLRIRSAVSASGVGVTIEDSGPGIPTKDLDAIFEPFFTTKSQGMGMGLAICRSIIELHQGRIRVSSGEPHGAIFHVELPS